MPRTARVIEVGYPHHIVYRGNNRQVIFFDDEDRYFYIKLLGKYTGECKCIINAYCLMCNHIHILLVPMQHFSIAKAMQKLNLTYTQYINKKYNRTGGLWEGRYFSAIIDTERYLWTVCRYIERNPVRAKLVDRAIDYKWSTVMVNVLGKSDGLTAPVWNSKEDRKAYASFLDELENEAEIELIEKSTFNNRPIGNDKFIALISGRLGVDLAKPKIGRPPKNQKA